MSRTKKSRKPGGAPTAKPKLSKQELAKVEKRTRKTTGKVAGNRQKEAAPKKSDANQQSKNKDPRIGNKTPIALGKITSKTEKAQQNKVIENKEKSAEIAGIRFIEKPVRDLSPEQELDAIEQDERLQIIITKQDDDIALTEEEVSYYNNLMERHQTLEAELGIEYDEDTEDEVDDEDDDEELWDKLDRPDLSDFEEK